MNDVETELKKIKDTLRTFIAWMDGELGRHNTTKLLDMLADQPPAPEPIEVEVWWHPEKGITGVEHTLPYRDGTSRLHPSPGNHPPREAMNLTDYPTPRTDAFYDGPCNNAITRRQRDFARQLEREASAWRAVAETLYARVEADRYRSYNGVESDDAMEAFDALKSQLTQP